MTPEEVQRLTRRLFNIQQIGMLTSTPFSVYLMGMITGLTAEQVKWIAVRFLVVTALPLGVIGPFMAIHSSLRQALPRPEDKPGDLLARMLRIPRRIELLVLISYTIGTIVYTCIGSIRFGVSWLTVPWATFIVLLLALITMIWMRTLFERQLQPFVLVEFYRAPTATPKGSGFFWPRQSWYLPYAFAVFVLSSLCLLLTIVTLKLSEAFNGFSQYLKQVGLERLTEMAFQSVTQTIQGSILPISALTAYLLITAAVSAWLMAKQMKSGAGAVQASMESLASGQPRLPQWASTDEMGDMAFATARVFEQLKAVSLSLKDSTLRLGQSIHQFHSFNVKQNELITLQAAALQETQVTAQEIKQTSLVASQRAESVLQRVEQANELSRSGEVAIERSLGGLQEIRRHVTEMATRIRALDDRARQIGNITRTVKDLADQSNMLALNAAIEAVRSGESGKGFGVVAREIRALADQSIQATNRVRNILQDISTAIRATVQITDQGAERIEASLKEVNVFSNNIHQLSAIVRDNADAVRQISAAVAQQNTGIGQIFQVVNELSRMMDDTMGRLQATTGATESLRDVASKVSNFVSSYAWETPDSGPDLATTTSPISEPPRDQHQQ